VRHQYDRPWGAGDRQGRLVVIAEKGDLDRAKVQAALA
jgi:cobalamin biosynthesis protein CobW